MLLLPKASYILRVQLFLIELIRIIVFILTLIIVWKIILRMNWLIDMLIVIISTSWWCLRMRNNLIVIWSENSAALFIHFIRFFRCFIPYWRILVKFFHLYLFFYFAFFKFLLFIELMVLKQLYKVLAWFIEIKNRILLFSSNFLFFKFSHQ
jgi:hypothetical protein